MKNNYTLLIKAIGIFLIRQLYSSLITLFTYFIQPDVKMGEPGLSLPRLNIILITISN